MQTPDLPDPRAVLGAVKARPGDVQSAVSQEQRPALTAPVRDAIDVLRAGTKERPFSPNKGTTQYREQAMT